MQDEILSGELARICGVSPDTIRHYERVGVLPAAVRGENGYRRFPRSSVARVLLIRRAIAIGFSLAELERILRQRDGGAPPCRTVRALAGEKLGGLDRRIAEMTAIREELARMLDEWDGRLAATPLGEAARLLEETGRGGQGAGRSGSPAAPAPRALRSAPRDSGRSAPQALKKG